MPNHKVRRELARFAEVLHLRPEDNPNFGFDSKWQPFVDYTE
jgi:hypothetical protein